MIRHAVLLSIQDGGYNTKIAWCFDGNLNTMLRIGNRLDESNCNYESKEIRKPYFDYSDNKRTLEFLGDI